MSSPSEKRQALAISTVRATASGKFCEQPRHFRRRLEVPFGIDGEPQAGFGEGAFFAHAGEHVGKRPALRGVIEHVVDGDERRAADRAAEFGEKPEPARLVAAMIMGAGEKSAAGRGCGQGAETGGEVSNRIVRRQRDKNLAFAGAENLLEGEAHSPFLA